MDVKASSEHKQDKNELRDDIFVNFVHQKRNESTHDWVDGNSLDAIV